jgi:lipopolysaccharide biosynthesis glycosyltransferase
MIISNIFNGKALSFDSVPTQTHQAAPIINPSLDLLRKNEEITHSCEDVLSELNNRFADAFNYSEEPLGEKNLIFFTLNYNIDYIHLFLYCLRSILNKDNSDAFDLLVMCPPAYEKLINDFITAQRIDLKGFNLMFHHVDEAKDGIEASMNKLKIYQFQDIKQYGKVLFLDVDIIAKEPVSELFNLELDPNKLYSAIHSASDHLHSTKFHKLVDYDLAKMNEFRDKEIYAFNAGQYLFVNSARMMNHMYNVDWLSRAWPGEYFFEQAFLNHYFNWFCISDVHLLDSYVKFVAVHLWDKADLASKYKLSYSIIHFAGHACDAAKKIDFIRQFHPNLI